jgi:hypothetical protein
MQLVMAVGIVIAAAVIVGALRAVGRAVGGIARGLGPALGHRPDPWPPGVQEEDRDRRWGR